MLRPRSLAPNSVAAELGAVGGRIVIEEHPGNILARADEMASPAAVGVTWRSVSARGASGTYAAVQIVP